MFCLILNYFVKGFHKNKIIGDALNLSEANFKPKVK